MKEAEEALDEKLEMRKKSFHVLVHSIQQLQAMLEREEAEEEGAAVAAEQEEQDNDDQEVEMVDLS